MSQGHRKALASCEVDLHVIEIFGTKDCLISLFPKNQIAQNVRPKIMVRFTKEPEFLEIFLRGFSLISLYFTYLLLWHAIFYMVSCMRKPGESLLTIPSK